MFKVVIDGKTPEELKARIREYLDAFGEQTTAELDRQLEMDLEKGQVTLPAVDNPVEIQFKKPADLEYGLDSRGVPWDSRIHAVTQAKNKDGSWRTRRGVEPEYVKRIESELKQQVPAAVGNVQSVASSIAPAATPTPTVPSMAAPSIVIPAVQPVAPIPPPPQPTTAHTFETFRAKMNETLALLVSQGKLTPDYLNQLKQYFQVEQIWQISETQALEMFEMFCKAQILTKVG